MKQKKRASFELNPDEFLIRPNHPEAKDINVYYKDKKIKCVGVIVLGTLDKEEDINEKEKREETKTISW